MMDINNFYMLVAKRKNIIKGTIDLIIEFYNYFLSDEKDLIKAQL